MAQNFANINKKFYGVNRTSKTNRKTVSFESGKERSYLLNSSVKKSYSVSLDLTKEEELIFWDWYDNQILSGSESFYLPDLLTQSDTKEYKIVGEPAIEGIAPRKLIMTLQEE